MRSFDEIIKNYKVNVFDSKKDVFIIGSFRFNSGDFASLVCTFDKGGLEHVSVSPFKKKHIPTWNEMCEVKDVFWKEEEEVYQIHPPKSEHINIMQNCLHLWRRKDGKRLEEV